MWLKSDGTVEHVLRVWSLGSCALPSPITSLSVCMGWLLCCLCTLDVIASGLTSLYHCLTPKLFLSLSSTGSWVRKPGGLGPEPVILAIWHLWIHHNEVPLCPRLGMTLQERASHPLPIQVPVFLFTKVEVSMGECMCAVVGVVACGKDRCLILAWSIAVWSSGCWEGDSQCTLSEL